MTVHVGEVATEVAVQGQGPPAQSSGPGLGGPGGGGSGAGGGGGSGWKAEDAHRKVETAMRRARCRVAAEGFDA